MKLNDADPTPPFFNVSPRRDEDIAAPGAARTNIRLRSARDNSLYRSASANSNTPRLVIAIICLEKNREFCNGPSIEMSVPLRTHER